MTAIKVRYLSMNVRAPEMFELVPYTDDWSKSWDTFIRDESRNGTIFHEREFLAYHPPSRFEDASCLFIENKGQTRLIRGVFPAALVDGAVISHPGSSYGGLLYGSSIKTPEVLGMLEQLFSHAKNLGASALEMRLAENLIYALPPDQELSFLLWHRGAQLKVRELGSCVVLQQGDWKDWARDSYAWSVSKASRSGVQVSSEIPLEQIYPLVEKNLAGRYGKKPVHSLDELNDLKRRFPEQLKAWTASLDGKPIATVVVFEANKSVTHSFYIAQDYDYSKYNALYYVFDRLLTFYKEKGFRYFNFGISSRSDWIKWGILAFKEGVGGRAVFRETWRIENLAEYQPYGELFEKDGTRKST